MTWHRTNSLTIVLILAAIILFFLSVTPARPEELTPKQILDKIDDMFRGESSHGTMTMTIVTANWERSLSLEFWSEGKDKSLIRILAPKKEKGTATLRVDDEIWNYLPKVKRVIKLPSSMMSASWMGSHFSNDDLVKESRMTRDYTFEITFQGTREGQEIIEITCHPKPEAPVVWGKVVQVIRKSDYLPIRSEYFDEDMNLARTLVFEDIGPLGDRTLPKVMTMLPENKPKEKTTMTYHEMDFDITLPSDTFSLRNLQQ
jgi:outer membrane lipoprotein-sorting protein